MDLSDHGPLVPDGAAGANAAFGNILKRTRQIEIRTTFSHFHFSRNRGTKCRPGGVGLGFWFVVKAGASRNAFKTPAREFLS